MKLLLISGDFPPAGSGEAAHAFYLAQHLAHRGVDVSVLTSTGYEGRPGCATKVYPVMRSWGWTELPRLLRVLRRCAPDAVLLMFVGGMYKHHPMITFVPTVWKAVRPTGRFVTQFENVGIDSADRGPLTRAARKAIARWVTRAGTDYTYGTLLRDSDWIIGLTERHLASLRRHSEVVASKSVLIPAPPLMSISDEPERDARSTGRALLGLEENRFVLLYYGYLYAGKGIESLLKAFQTVAAKRREAALVIVGGALDNGWKAFRDASERYVRENVNLCRMLGIADRVVWAGARQADDGLTSRYFRAADACVLPFDNGIHLNNSTFAAAAAHGLPIITTRGDMVENVFVSGENVLLCEPRRPESLAAAIQSVIEDDELRARLRDGARTMAREVLSWDRAIERTVPLLA